MLNKAGERELAYMVLINSITPIPGYDRVELAHVGGWTVVVGKGEFKEGDPAVYFEIDSKLPEVKPFSDMNFLAKKHYKVQTQRMCKSLSQGLLISAKSFGWYIDLFDGIPGMVNPKDNEIYRLTDESCFLTKKLGVTYAVSADNERKSNKVNKDTKYNSMCARHFKLAKKKWWRWLMKREWGKHLLFVFFGRKKDNPRGFPGFVSKTDEERIENLPFLLNDNSKLWIVTEKLDGTSCTYALERKFFNKFEYYVCSRNVRQRDEKQDCYHDHNIYWDLSFKYDIENVLKKYLKEHPEEKWICIQGEGVGSVQGNPLKLKKDDLYIFNVILSSAGRLPSLNAELAVKDWGMKHVPVLGIEALPASMEEMKKRATSQSLINPEVLREGLVYRSLDGKESFKNVSNEFLLSKKN